MIWQVWVLIIWCGINLGSLFYNLGKSNQSADVKFLMVLYACAFYGYIAYTLNILT